MKAQQERYTRQIMLDDWGPQGQERLRQATVFQIGAGGLGSPVAYYLAAVGIGKLIICDMDVVDISNLNRQILHGDGRIGVNKAVSAAITLHGTNPEMRVIPVPEKVTGENIRQLSQNADIFVDCLDNFDSRYTMMREAARRRLPLVHGSVWGMEGRLSVFHVPQTPCLQCAFPSAPPKEVFPIVGATTGVIGSLQALEVIKHLTGVGVPLYNRLLVWDGASSMFQKFQISKQTGCPICGQLSEKEGCE